MACDRQRVPLSRSERLSRPRDCAGCAAPARCATWCARRPSRSTISCSRCSSRPRRCRTSGCPRSRGYTVDGVVRECEELLRAGVNAVILFGIPEEKDDEGSGAWIENGIVQQALRALRPRFPELLLLTDVCLCEYTAHGHCGVLRGEEIDNDSSLELIARTAVSHVEAGADAVCPSDMMDGRIAADPRRAARDADRRLLGQVRLVVLRAVPRGRRLDAVVRRPARLPDGSRQRPRGAARVRARRRRGRRRADREAGAARTST